MAALDDSALEERIDELKTTRDQAQVDADRAIIALESLGQAVTPAALASFAKGSSRPYARLGGRLPA